MPIFTLNNWKKRSLVVHWNRILLRLWTNSFAKKKIFCQWLAKFVHFYEDENFKTKNESELILELFGTLSNNLKFLMTNFNLMTVIKKQISKLSFKFNFKKNSFNHSKTIRRFFKRKLSFFLKNVDDWTKKNFGLKLFFFAPTFSEKTVSSFVVFLFFVQKSEKKLSK